MKVRTRREGTHPIPLPLSSSSLSFYTFLWSSLSFYTFVCLPFYTFICPLTVMAILTRSWTLFIFIHPKTGIVIISTQIQVPTKYSILKLKLTSQLPNLSFPSTCSMNVPFHVFALHIARCSIQPHLLPPPCFNPFCELSKVRSYFFFFNVFSGWFLLFNSLCVSFEVPNFIKLLETMDIKFNSNWDCFRMGYSHPFNNCQILLLLLTWWSPISLGSHEPSLLFHLCDSLSLLLHLSLLSLGGSSLSQKLSPSLSNLEV